MSWEVLKREAEGRIYTPVTVCENRTMAVNWAKRLKAEDLEKSTLINRSWLPTYFIADVEMV